MTLPWALSAAAKGFQLHLKFFSSFCSLFIYVLLYVYINIYIYILKKNIIIYKLFSMFFFFFFWGGGSEVFLGLLAIVFSMFFHVFFFVFPALRA